MTAGVHQIFFWTKSCLVPWHLQYNSSIHTGSEFVHQHFQLISIQQWEQFLLIVLHFCIDLPCFYNLRAVAGYLSTTSHHNQLEFSLCTIPNQGRQVTTPRAQHSELPIAEAPCKDHRTGSQVEKIPCAAAPPGNPGEDGEKNRLFFFYFFMRSIC